MMEEARVIFEKSIDRLTRENEELLKKNQLHAKIMKEHGRLLKIFPANEEGYFKI
jgi:hypothetical protein